MTVGGKKRRFDGATLQAGVIAALWAMFFVFLALLAFPFFSEAWQARALDIGWLVNQVITFIISVPIVSAVPILLGVALATWIRNAIHDRRMERRG